MCPVEMRRWRRKPPKKRRGMPRRRRSERPGPEKGTWANRESACRPYFVQIAQEKERIEREEMLARAREAHKEQREKEEDGLAACGLVVHTLEHCVRGPFSGVPESAEQRSSGVAEGRGGHHGGACGSGPGHDAHVRAETEQEWEADYGTEIKVEGRQSLGQSRQPVAGRNWLQSALTLPGRGLPLRLLTRRKEVAWIWAGEARMTASSRNDMRNRSMNV